MTEQPALDANIGDIVKHRGSKSKVRHRVVGLDIDPYTGGGQSWAHLRSTNSGRRSHQYLFNLTIIERASK